MIGSLKVWLLTTMLTVWSAVALAQTAPDSGTSPATTGAVEDTGTTMSWLWFVVAVVVVFALLYYFFGRNRSTRI